MAMMEAYLTPRSVSTECRCAATNELLGYSPLHSENELQDMINKAKGAQVEWAALSVNERVKYIIKIRQYIMEHIDELSEVITRDNGKTRIDALAAEVLPAVLSLGYYCRKAKEFLKDRSMGPAHAILCWKTSKIVHVPWGVVAIISPWNYPFAIPFSEVIMALLAGNSVILKTATQTQMVGLTLAKCIEAADLPPGVFNFINLPGSKAGDLFLDTGVDKLFFTGSVPVGQYLMKKASETLTPVSLELGGNDPMLVCEDADIYRAVMGAIWAGLSNAGQSCGGVERIYVHERVYEPFMKMLKEEVESLRVGFGNDFNTDIGAMTTPQQVETVKRHLEDALSKGAVIYAQSKLPNDHKYQNLMPAIVLTNVNHDMLTMREETFGPILAVKKVRDMEEAILLANDSDLGLSASVWSKSRSNAEAIARRIECGAVNVNDHLMSHALAETPWGGFKKSSIGRTHGAIGFEEMTQPQVIIHDIMPFLRKDLWWHPNSEKVYQGIKGVLQIFHGRGLKIKAVGLWDVMKVVFRMFKEEHRTAL